MTHVLQADVEEQANVGVIERVVDVSALLAVSDEPARPKQTQVVRARSLRKARDGGEVANTQLTRFQQGRDQSDPARVRENTERLRKILKHGLAWEPFQNGLNAFRLDALDRATVKRGHSSGWGRLHSHEDNIAAPG
jgi:hypothetical protein